MRVLRLLALLLLGATAAEAQTGFSLATATITDPAGLAYQNCHGNVAFVPSPTATTQPFLSGSLFPTTVSISQCDSFGTFSNLPLADNNAVSDGHTGGQGSQWRFNICSNTTPQVCFAATVTVTGATPNLSGALSALAPALPEDQILANNNTWTGTNRFNNSVFANPIISTTANPATSGTQRFANTDTFCWRNGANSSNLCLAPSSASGNLPADFLNGSFPGVTYGVVIASASPTTAAAGGQLRFAATDTASWRNQAGNGDVSLRTLAAIGNVPADTLNWTGGSAGSFQGTFIGNVTNQVSNTGVLRLGSTDAVKSRNNGNSADFSLLTSNAGDVTVLSDPGAAAIWLRNNIVQVGTSNADFNLNAIGGANSGQAININAQSAVTAGNSGGNILLAAGQGATTGPGGSITLTPGTSGTGTTNSIILNNGINKSTGSAWQAIRTTAGCATAAAAGATCDVTVTWTSAFGNANYTPWCTGFGITSGVPVHGGIVSQVAASVVFRTVAGTAAAAQYTNIYCIGVHD